MGSVRTVVGVRGTTYMARVRKNGLVDTATFQLKSDANNWITQQEAGILSGKPIDVAKFRKLLLTDIFEDFIQNGKLNEEQKSRTGRLKKLMATLRLRDFDSAALSIFLDEMKMLDVPRPDDWKKPHPYFNGSMVEIEGVLTRRKMSSSTIRKYYYAIRTCLMWHSKMNGYHFDNKPFQDNPPPPAWGKPRTRIIEQKDNELERLLNACNQSYVNQENLKDIIKFQIYSAMRMGETLLMEWHHIRLDKKEPWNSYILIPKENQKTRNHSSTEDREVPLIPELFELVNARLMKRKGKPNEKVFPFWKDSSTLSKRFRVIWKNSGVENMKAHDFRHTGVTKFFEDTNLTDIEIGKISGHTDINTLKRYHKSRAKAIGSKLWKSLGAMPASK